MFAPLTLMILLRQNALWQSRLFNVAIPTLVITAAMVVSFIYVSKSETLKLKQHVADHGMVITEQLKAKILSYQETVSSLNNFIEVTPNFDLSIFSRFTEQSFAEHQDLQALSWNPIVVEAARKKFEAVMAREHGLPNFQITQRNSQNQLLPSESRPQYVVVRYINPLVKNSKAIGYDIASEPVRKAAIDTAIQTRTPTMTSPIRLVQETGISVGVLLLHPAYMRRSPNTGERAMPVGFAVGVFRVEEMLTTLIDENLPQGLSFTLEDPAAPEGSRLLYRYGEKNDLSGYDWTGDMAIGGRSWHLALNPSQKFLYTNTSLLAWLVLATGLFLTSLFQAFLLSLTGRSSFFKRKIDEQTNLLEEKIRSQQQIELSLRNSEANLQQQLLFAGTLNKISRTVVEQDEPKTILIETTRDVGVALDADRVLIYDVSFGDWQARGLAEWLNPAHPEVHSTIDSYTLDAFIGGLTEMRSSGRFLVSQQDQVNPALLADGSGEMLHGRMSIRSLLWYPFAFRENGYFLLVFHHLHARREWACDELEFLGSASQLVSIELDKIALMEVQRQAQSEREHLLGLISDSEERWKFALEGAGDGVWDWNIAAGNLTLSKRWFEIQGFSEDELEQDISAWAKLVHPDDARQVDLALNDHLEGRTPQFACEHRVRCADGEYKWILGRGMVVSRDAQGKAMRAIGTHSDITGRKLAELEHEQLLQIIMQSPDFISTSDMQAHLKFLNPAGARMVGLPEDVDLAGLQIKDMHPAWAAKRVHEEGIPTVLQQGCWQSENALYNAVEGREIPVSQILLVHRDADGIPLLFSTIMRDITGFKQAEKALQQAILSAEAANRAKSEFLANMSHEIRTPMNAILGMAEILSESELSADQRKYVGVFQNAGSNLLELINDILDMSKVEAGQMELCMADFSLERALEELLELHAVKASGKGLELVLDMDSSVPESVHGDAQRLKQCLTNLVGNAIKFSPRGLIVLTVRALGGDMLEFSVSDCGIGIPAEKRESIFDAFSQADGSITRQFGGTGLGLTITRRLVKLMGGEIRAYSEEGKGSTFVFNVIMPAAAVSTLAAADLRGLKVLVVCEQSVNRRIVRNPLQGLGAEVCEAGSAPEVQACLALAAAQGKPFALALIESQLGLHAPELFALPAAWGIRVVVLADAAQHGLSAQYPELTFMLKPIKRRELIRCVSSTLQPAAVHGEVSSQPVPDASKEGLNILLAEDNKDNILLVKVFLKQSRHQVTVAEDGLVAVEKFRNNRYDVILMDVQMPNMGGYEATAEIRRIEKEEGREPIRIIALTAHALKEDEQRSLAAGCNGHLTKPIKKNLLLETLG